MSAADRDKWDARYRARAETRRDPSDFVVEVVGALAEPGRALDIAGGDGRHALWLAEQGWDVTLVDISTAGLELARARATERGLTMATLARDLEVEALPPGPFDLAVCVGFLYRPIFSALAAVLGPGGRVVVEHPTLTNLERHEHPSRRFLLEDGELPGLIAPLELIRYDEGWTRQGRHMARLVARKP